jgi:hypothetical protein
VVARAVEYHACRQEAWLGMQDAIERARKRPICVLTQHFTEHDIRAAIQDLSPS